MSKTTKKVIPASTVIKALITGFISYGVLLAFIVIACYLGINRLINKLPQPNFEVLSITMPVMLAFVIYFLSHTVCRLATIDLFNKCKTDSKNYPEITKKMNAFFLVFAIVVILFTVALLMIKISNTEASINLMSNQYLQVFSKEFTTRLTNKVIEDFNHWKVQSIISTVVIEVAIFVSMISLIPFQQKLITQYNITRKPRTKKEDNDEDKENKE